MALTPAGKFYFTIVWTVPGYGKTTVIGPACDTEEEAFTKAKEIAHIMGWRRPKLREWWRWRDKRYDEMPDV